MSFGGGAGGGDFPLRVNVAVTGLQQAQSGLSQVAQQTTTVNSELANTGRTAGTAAGGMNSLGTATGNAATKTRSFTQNAGAVAGVLTGSVGAISGVIGGYVGLQKAQVAVAGTALKLSRAQVSETTAQQNFDKLLKNGVTSGADYEKALKKLTNAHEAVRIATEKNRLKEHDLQMETLHFFTGTIPAALGTIGSLVTSLSLFASGTEEVAATAPLAADGIQAMNNAAGSSGLGGTLAKVLIPLAVIGTVLAVIATNTFNVRTSLNAFGVALGKNVPLLKPFLEFIQSIGAALGLTQGDVKNWPEQFNKSLNTIKGYFDTFASNAVKVFGQISTGFQTAFKQLSSGDIRGALSTLGALFSDLWTKQVRPTLDSIYQGFVGVFKSFGVDLPPTLNDVGKAIQGLYDTYAKPTVDKIQAALNTLGTDIKTGNITKFATDSRDIIVNAFNTAKTTISQIDWSAVGKAISDGIGQLAALIVPKAKEAATALYKALTDPIIWSTAAAVIATGFSQLGTLIKPYVDQAAQAFADYFRNFDWGKAAVDTITTFISAIKLQIQVQGDIGKFLADTFFGNIGPKYVFPAADTIIANLIAGMTQAITTDLPKAVGDWFSPASISAGVKNLGATGKAIVDAIFNAPQTVTAAATGGTGAATSWLTSARTYLVTNFPKTFGEIFKITGNIQTSVNAMGKAIGDYFTRTVPTFFVNSGKAIIDAIYNGFVGAGAGIATSVTGMVQRFADLFILDIPKYFVNAAYGISNALISELPTALSQIPGTIWDNLVNGLVPAIKKKIKELSGGLINIGYETGGAAGGLFLPGSTGGDIQGGGAAGYQQIALGTGKAAVGTGLLAKAQTFLKGAINGTTGAMKFLTDKLGNVIGVQTATADSTKDLTGATDAGTDAEKAQADAFLKSVDSFKNYNLLAGVSSGVQAELTKEITKGGSAILSQTIDLTKSVFAHQELSDETTKDVVAIQQFVQANIDLASGLERTNSNMLRLNNAFIGGEQSVQKHVEDITAAQAAYGGTHSALLTFIDDMGITLPTSIENSNESLQKWIDIALQMPEAFNKAVDEINKASDQLFSNLESKIKLNKKGGFDVGNLLSDFSKNELKAIPKEVRLDLKVNAKADFSAKKFASDFVGIAVTETNKGMSSAKIEGIGKNMLAGLERDLGGGARVHAALQPLYAEIDNLSKYDPGDPAFAAELVRVQSVANGILPILSGVTDQFDGLNTNLQNGVAPAGQLGTNLGGIQTAAGGADPKVAALNTTFAATQQEMQGVVNLGVVWVANMNVVSNATQGMEKQVGGAFGGVRNAFNNLNSIANAFQGQWSGHMNILIKAANTFENQVGGAFGGIRNAFNNLNSRAGSFQGQWSGHINTEIKAGNNFASAFGKAVTSIAGSMNNLVNKSHSMQQGFARSLNLMIQGVHNLQNAINGLHGKTVEIQQHYAAPTGTKLAKGFHGMVTQPTTVIVGEKGPERLDVTPKAELDERERAGIISNNKSGTGGESRVVHEHNHTTIINLDGREIAKTTRKYVDEDNQQFA